MVVAIRFGGPCQPSTVRPATTEPLANKPAAKSATPIVEPKVHASKPLLLAGYRHDAFRLVGMTVVVTLASLSRCR